MQEKDMSTFQFGKDNDDHEEMMHLELQELKMEKLSHRVTLFTILIPCMVGIILIIAYLDIKDRVTRTSDTGAIGVQKLSKDIESKFSSLSLEQAKIKDTLSKLSLLEDSSAFVQSRLKTLQTSIKHLESSSINRDELSRVVERMNERFKSIPADIKTETQNLKTASQQSLEDITKISGQLDQLSEALLTLNNDVKRLDKNISDLEDRQVTKSELDLALKLKEIAAKQTLLDTTASLEKKIKILEEKVRAIQTVESGAKKPTGTGDADTSAPAASGGTVTPESKAASDSGATPQTPSSPRPSSAATEDIIEQNIE
jgi:peptidoglycan hydrolase CwlO-like protein